MQLSQDTTGITAANEIAKANINEVQKVAIRNLVELAKNQAVPVGGYAIVDPGNGTLPKGDPKAALLPTGEGVPLVDVSRRREGLDAENEGWKQLRLLLGQPEVGKVPTHIVLVTPFNESFATRENADKKWVLEHLADSKNTTRISTVIVGVSSFCSFRDFIAVRQRG